MHQERVLSPAQPYRNIAPEYRSAGEEMKMRPVNASGASRSQNNFNILRFLAASLVILSHGIELPSGLAARDWAHHLTGQPFSWYAVNLFFVLSGYLIYGSWDAKPSIVAFTKARCLRILPGLFVMLILCVVILGSIFSTIHFAQFISSEPTLRYFVGCLSIIFTQMELPGVFESNPLRAVNGSLWTLRYEIVCYATVASLGVLGLLAIPTARRMVLLIGIAIAVTATVWIEAQGLPLEGKVYITYQLARLGLCFQLGCLYREFRVVVPRIEFAIALVVMMFLTTETAAFTPVACLAVAHLAFWCAFVPNNHYCRLARTAPDYSYGLYIYAFPVQQALIATIQNASAPQVIVLGFIITLAFAAFSWHLIEKPALSLKEVPIFSRSKFARAGTRLARKSWNKES
jgi:peptidoglycan/LPS O-acetylase OafA/YrhL